MRYCRNAGTVVLGVGRRAATDHFGQGDTVSQCFLQLHNRRELCRVQDIFQPCSCFTNMTEIFIGLQMFSLRTLIVAVFSGLPYPSPAPRANAHPNPPSQDLPHPDVGHQWTRNAHGLALAAAVLCWRARRWTGRPCRKRLGLVRGRTESRI
ncbi:hypothetical protein KC325_g311 [Hortaea werneckii]|nr:hypothetical protein KC325_g311 [Hortaea werneckii]